NPEARIVLRLFDESLAVKVAGAFTLPAISTAHVAAPAFIAAATGRRIYQEFQLGGQLLHLIDLSIDAAGTLRGQKAGAVQSSYAVNIVMHQGPEGANINPAHATVLEPGDSVVVIAPLDRLLALEADNHPADASSQERRPIPLKHNPG